MGLMCEDEEGLLLWLMDLPRGGRVVSRDL